MRRGGRPETTDEDSWGSVAMKRFIACCALLGVVVLTGCSGDSPSSPVVPTPAADTWAITSFTVDEDNPWVETVVTLSATATKNGGPAPDGTWVEFKVVGYQYPADPGVALFPEYDADIATVATHGGVATVTLAGAVPRGDDGEYLFTSYTWTIQARVVDVVRSLPVTFHVPQGPPGAEALQIFMPLVPDHGLRDGGERVTLTGRGIVEPIRVFFTVKNAVLPDTGDEVDDRETVDDEFEARVISVQESSLPDSPVGIIVIETPHASTLLHGMFDSTGGTAPDTYRVCVDYEINVVVNRLAAPIVLDPPATDEDNYRLPEAFTYDNEQATRDECSEEPIVVQCPPAPEIYVVVPDHGTPRGGEQVTVLGRYFGWQWDPQANEFVVVPTDSMVVEFTTTNPARTLLGIDPVVSPDGHQILVTTPVFGATPLEEDVVASVTVRNILPYDTAACPSLVLEDTKDDAFIFTAEEPTPEVLGVAPTSGPVDGGTVVSVFGHGFQFPARVEFIADEISREAVVIEVNDDTTPSDYDTIVCVTPTFADTENVPPFTVEVRVTNLETGKVCETCGEYTYGQVLYITGNSPTEGGPGTVVTIYGGGFEDPLVVDYLGRQPPLRIETVAVSGSEVVARFPDDTEPECDNGDGEFRITLTERPYEEGQGFVEGGEFRYLGLDPTVVRVDPQIVQETLGGAGVDPFEVVITGTDFTENVLVAFGTYVIPSQYVTEVNSTTIQVNPIPAPDDFDLNWNRSSCVTVDGFPGTRRIATPVAVTVTNIPAQCANTLGGAIVYEPETNECVVEPTIAFTLSGAFADTPAGTCSPPVTLTVDNNIPGATLDITGLTLLGRFFFDAGATVQAQAGFSLASFTSQPFNLYFCPNVDNGLEYFGSLTIRSSNAVNDPVNVPLTGQELLQAIMGTSPYTSGDTWTFPTTPAGACSVSQSLTITNTGDDDLVLNPAPAATLPFVISSPATSPVAPGGSTSLSVQFCPTLDNGLLQTGTLTVTGVGALGSPAVINLEGQETP